MIRRLFALLALLWLAWLVARMVRGASRTVRSAADAPRPDAAMVRDRICNTFLPRAQAVVARLGAEEHFFCSDSCRRKFLDRADAQDRGDGARA